MTATVAATVGLLTASPQSAEVMPAAQQNALVAKHCTVCHTDAADNGGLSLQHFDAAHAAPSLMAMLLSKITGGVSLGTVVEMSSNTAAKALVDDKAQSGAMRAAGIPMPDKGTLEAFIQALAQESDGAEGWTVERSATAPGKGQGTIASILREKPSTENGNHARAYRLIVSCDRATQRGSMQVAWSPVPQGGTLTASVDGRPAMSFAVSGSEQMGNGSGVVSHGLAAFRLTDSGDDRSIRLPLPKKALTIGELFPGETVVFPFASLAQDAHDELAACFPRAD